MPSQEYFKSLGKMVPNLSWKIKDYADHRGPFTNEELVGETLAPFRDRVAIATQYECAHWLFDSMAASRRYKM
jgi:hypothetical protein